MDFLSEEGYTVTQATVSRDIRDLDLIKVALPGGSYKYVVGGGSKKVSVGVGAISHAVADTVISVTCAQNIIVLKTASGMAQAVAVAIDRVSDPMILGSVAGDDTIIVVVPDAEAAQSVAAKLKKHLSID